MAEEEEDESSLSAIGFMFDANLAKHTVSFNFNDLEVLVRTVGDKPGHKQSGHYLWPASNQCAQYLVSNWDHIRSNRVLELGSGCGLPGLLCMKFPGVQQVVFTDYDPGVLRLIGESIDINKPTACSSLEILEWGDRAEASKVAGSEKFPLVIGTDLIYCKEVIEPLFTTVSVTLARSGVFILVTSFDIGQVRDGIGEIDQHNLCCVNS